ncbi:MAG: universal stress protein [Methanothrix sp.]|nr:universal stress protein [Methanothrix sp.]MDD4446797.1 universal stress protein [Methanothrix sp.]
MFEKVLIPTDFSKHAQKVIECVGQIPGVNEVLLLNVVARPTITRFWDPVAEVKAAEKRLSEMKSALMVPGVGIKARALTVLEGEVASAIQKVAEDEKVSLVAMGARGKSLIESVLLGSTSRNVLRYGNTHLLIMRYRKLEETDQKEQCGKIFSKVLFPTDFSQPSEAALSFLKGLPDIGELLLLNVVSKGETEEEIEANVAIAKEKINEISSELSKDGMNVTAKVVLGHPVEAIRYEAEMQDVSLIAMSSQGAVAIKKGRIGSTAYDVANFATRPVLILRRSKIALYYI